MQTDILEQNPGIPLKVYAVWFNMVWTDSRGRWPDRALSDARVTHFWDEEKALGRWYDARWGDGKHVLWDVFLLYPPGSKLDLPSESLLAFGGTIHDERDELRAAVEALALDAGPEAFDRSGAAHGAEGGI